MTNALFAARWKSLNTAFLNVPESEKYGNTFPLLHLVSRAPLLLSLLLLSSIPSLLHQLQFIPPAPAF